MITLTVKLFTSAITITDGVTDEESETVEELEEPSEEEDAIIS